MKTSLLHELSPDFSDLIESVGMRVTQERREESFDNALVELEGEEFSLIPEFDERYQSLKDSNKPIVNLQRRYVTGKAEK